MLIKKIIILSVLFSLCSTLLLADANQQENDTMSSVFGLSTPSSQDGGVESAFYDEAVKKVNDKKNPIPILSEKEEFKKEPLFTLDGLGKGKKLNDDDIDKTLRLWAEEERLKIERSKEEKASKKFKIVNLEKEVARLKKKYDEIKKQSAKSSGKAKTSLEEQKRRVKAGLNQFASRNGGKLNLSSAPKKPTISPITFYGAYCVKDTLESQEVGDGHCIAIAEKRTYKVGDNIGFMGEKIEGINVNGIKTNKRDFLFKSNRPMYAKKEDKRKVTRINRNDEMPSGLDVMLAQHKKIRE